MAEFSEKLVASTQSSGGSSPFTFLRIKALAEQILIVTHLLERQVVTLPPALTLAVQLFLAAVIVVNGVALPVPLTAATLFILNVLLPGISSSDDMQISATMPLVISESLE